MSDWRAVEVSERAEEPDTAAQSGGERPTCAAEVAAIRERLDDFYGLAADDPDAPHTLIVNDVLALLAALERVTDERDEAREANRELHSECAKAVRERDGEHERANVMERERDWEYEVVQPDLLNRAEAAEAERDRLREALERIADENDPLLGIGSECEFARAALAGGAAAGEKCPDCDGDAGDNWCDRSLCPCSDTMHTRCRNCGHALDGCSFESVAGGAANSKETPSVGLDLEARRAKELLGRADETFQRTVATVSEHVGHIARGCRSGSAHNPAVHESAIEAALADLGWLLAESASEEASR